MSVASGSVRDSWDNPWTDTPTMQRDEDQYELLANGELRTNASAPRVQKKSTYVDGATIGTVSVSWRQDFMSYDTAARLAT